VSSRASGGSRRPQPRASEGDFGGFPSVKEVKEETNVTFTSETTIGTGITPAIDQREGKKKRILEKEDKYSTRRNPRWRALPTHWEVHGLSRLKCWPYGKESR